MAKFSLHRTRLIGILLLLVSIVGGYLSITRADHRVIVLAAAGPIPPGQIISASDIRAIRAAIDTSIYATDPQQVIGQTTRSVINQGELLALSQFAKPTPARLIAVPVHNINLPVLGRGDRIDLYAATKLIAENLAVVNVQREATFGVVTVSVAPNSVKAVVDALSEDVVLVKVA